MADCTYEELLAQHDAATKRIVELEARVAKAEHVSKEAWVQVAYHEHLETSFVSAIERLKKERDEALAVLERLRSKWFVQED